MVLNILVWCVVMASAESVPQEEIKTIWCVNDDILSQPNLISGVKDEDMLCKAESTKIYPFTVEHRLTPPSLESLNVTYKTYKTSKNNTSKQIAVYISWTYKIQYFHQVENYHIELNYFKPPGDPKQYLMTWGKNLTSALENTSAKLVKFNYILCGRPQNYHIHPGDFYRFRVQACPIYQEVDEPQYTDIAITIPGCGNKDISKTKPCECPPGRIRMGDRCRKSQQVRPVKNAGNLIANATTAIPQHSSEKQDLEQTHVIIIMIGALLIIVFLTFIIWAYRRRKFTCCHHTSKKSVQGKRRLLLICSSDNSFLEPINKLINILTEFPHLDVKCNLRQRNEIGQRGIQDWTKKHVSDADIVVFFITSSYDVTSEVENEKRLLENIDHQVGMVLKATEKIIVSKADNEDKKFIIADIKNCAKKENLQYFKHFKLPSDFNKFAKMVVGDKGCITTKDKTIFLHSLAIAQLGGYGPKDMPVDQVYEKDEVQNDLDHPSQCALLACGNGSLYPPNISCDEPPSYESDRLQSFSTTDFNSEQFRKTGVRPKVTC